MRSANPVLTAVLAAALIAATLPLAGCLIRSSSSSRLRGDYVGPTTFSQIEPGETTAEWVRAVLGEPTRRETLDDGSQIWVWSHERRRKSSGGVFLIFGGSSDRETVGRAYVQIEDGIVTKAWRD